MSNTFKILLTEIVAKPQAFFQMEIFYLLSNSNMLELHMILTSMQNIRLLRGGDHIDLLCDFCYIKWVFLAFYLIKVTMWSPTLRGLIFCMEVSIICSSNIFEYESRWKFFIWKNVCGLATSSVKMFNFRCNI